MAKDYFPKVKEAREALRAKALAIYEMQMKIIAAALAADDFEVAANANQFLMEHMPPDDEGHKMLETSIDKQVVDKGSNIPTIQIGIALGPAPTSNAKQLPPASKLNVIDISDE